MKHIGAIIRELRIEKGLLQKELAKVLGIARNTLSQYEMGLMNPSYEVLIKISLYFNVSTDYLLGLENDMGDKVFCKQLEDTIIYKNGDINFK